MRKAASRPIKLTHAKYHGISIRESAVIVGAKILQFAVALCIHRDRIIFAGAIYEIQDAIIRWRGCVCDVHGARRTHIANAGVLVVDYVKAINTGLRANDRAVSGDGTFNHWFGWGVAAHVHVVGITADHRFCVDGGHGAGG